MIKLQDKTPDWVYELATIAGQFSGDALKHNVLYAKALAGHVAIVEKAPDEQVWANDEFLTPRPIAFLPRDEYTVEIQYTTGGSHTFSRVSQFEFFIQKEDEHDRYFIVFYGMDDATGELDWYVGRPVKIVAKRL